MGRKYKARRLDPQNLGVCTLALRYCCLQMATARIHIAYCLQASGLNDQAARFGLMTCAFYSDPASCPGADPLGAAVLAPDYRVLFIDRGVLEVLGRKPEEVLDRPLAELLADGPDSHDPLWERLQRSQGASLSLPLALAGAGGALELLVAFHPLYGGATEGYRLVVFYPPVSPVQTHRGSREDGVEERPSDSALLAALPEPVALLDRACRLRAANAAFFRWIGADRQGQVGQPFLSLCPDPRLANLVYTHLTSCLDEGKTVVEELCPSQPGEPDDYQLSLMPYSEAEGGIQGVVIAIKDLSELRRAERRLAQAEAVYAAISEGILITDAQGIAVAVNLAFTRITGYAASEVLGQRPHLLNAQWHTRAFFIGLWRRLRKQGLWRGEVWSRRKDGEVYRQRLTIRRLLNRQGTVSNYVVILADQGPSPVTRPSDSLIHYDPLTGLPNRLLFELRLDHAILQGARRGSLLAVLLIDLDHFSHINASLGYRIGDELLRAIALRLREAIHHSDTLARLHADRFALLLEWLNDPEEATQLANRLRALMSQPLWIRGHEIHVNLSIGIALMTDQGKDARDLMLKAGLALRQAKCQGRGGIRMIASSAQVESKGGGWIARLQAALERSEIQVRYRPGCDLGTGDPDVIEAALCWAPADLGTIVAERLWTLAEEGGLILELGELLLNESCRQFAQWIDQGLAPERLLIPISESQCLCGDLVRSVERQLLAAPALDGHLELGFSERLLVKHREPLTALFQGLNELRVGIWINDVGLGWTAPALLQRLPIRALRIHASFIEALPNAPHELAVVEALIAMAQALEIEIRADGVRTQEQRYQLLDLGCLKAQGDLFGEAMPGPNLEAWLNLRANP